MNYKSWTEEQLSFITENMNLTDKELSLHIGKTERAVRTHRRRKGLLKVTNTLCPSKWGQDEIDTYVSLWKEKTGNELAKHYGVSRRAICHINQKFGLIKDEAWKSEVAKVSYQHQKNPRKKRKDAKNIGDIVTRKNSKGFNLPLIMTENGWQRLHVYNWLQAGKEILKGHVLYFKDRNPENCEVENLELRTRAEVANENRDSFYLKNPPKKSIKRATPPQKKEKKCKIIKPTREQKKMEREQKKIEWEQRKAQKRLDRIKAQEEKKRELIEKKKRSNVEREWQAAKIKRNVKRFENKPLDLSSKIAVKLDHRTTVYITPGTDIERIRKQYLKAS